jgi:peptidoglycan-N-acetylglucosamine deacetylase
MIAFKHLLRSVTILLGLGWGAISVSPAAANPTLAQVVEAFYQAVAAQRCDEAAQLRPGYSPQQCQEIIDVTDLQIIPVKLSRNDAGDLAVVELQVTLHKTQSSDHWHGYLSLIHTAGAPQIVNDSYLSHAQAADLERYVRSPQYRAAQEALIPRTTAPAVKVEMTAATPALATAATALRDACWTPDELRSRPVERQIKNHEPVDHTPPASLLRDAWLPPLDAAAAQSIRSVHPTADAKLVALTFDLCEQADEVTGYDGAIVDLLRAQQVAATFYAGGKWMRSHPERTMQLMADPLFELGNHAWTHGNLRVLRGLALDEQIQWTQTQYALLRTQLLSRACAVSVPHAAALIPELPTTFRFPYGTCDRVALERVAQAGLWAIQWDVVTSDPVKAQSAAQIVKVVLNQVRPGSIVIGHGNGRGWHTHEALRTLIPALKQRGYEFVTVRELLRRGTPNSVESCYELRPGDNLRYDKLFGDGTQ